MQGGQQAVPQQAVPLSACALPCQCNHGCWVDAMSGITLARSEPCQMAPGSGCIVSASGAAASALLRRFLLPRLPRRLPFGRRHARIVIGIGSKTLGNSQTEYRCIYTR
jgi:hypothetical protein